MDNYSDSSSNDSTDNEEEEEDFVDGDELVDGDGNGDGGDLVGEGDVRDYDGKGYD